jgi:pyruvate dehydrogenase E1 component
MYFDDFKHQLPDIDEAETHEWLDSLDQVVDQEGEVRARFLMYKLLKRSRQRQVGLPSLTQTRYINTISPEQEPYFPGDEELERRIRRLIRWNAVAMVLRANTRFPGIGGHMSTYASAATLYEVGFNHFFRGKEHPGGGDQIYFQGHAAPGIYARAFLEGRLSEDDLDHFRRETGGHGLSSYPHPRLMPDFWEFRRSRWASGRWRPSTRRALTATCTTAVSRTPATSGSGPTSATARWTSPRRSAGSRLPPARASTTSSSS